MAEELALPLSSRGASTHIGQASLSSSVVYRDTSETRGFMKALIVKNSDQILGFTMFCVEAGEVIAVVQTAMLSGMPYTALRDASELETEARTRA